MICTQCGTENRSDRRFCMECGTVLARVCETCGTANEAGARFCGSCGSALAAASGPGQAGASAPRNAAGDGPGDGPGDGTGPGGTAQRRLVTVLFADLVGFTPFAEERDPEDVRAALTQYADLSREIVARYGGTVEKFIGDAVMAVWGAPVAHEDDAERAVRAALELVDGVQTLGPGIQARAGILTGEAAVTVGATDQAIVAGDLVNTAARLQAAAQPGSVLVGEATMRGAEASLAFEPAGEHELKGKAAPVKAWRALRVIAQRRGAGRADGLETPFVGRDEEFRALRDVLHLASRDPRARLVSVTGPAGIGKSRLAWELEKYVDGVVEPIYWHRGRCPAYGDGVAFWALGEMVRRRCGLVEGADEAQTRAKVAETVAEYVDDDSERAWIQSALLALLGLEPDQSVARELLFAAWRRFFEQVATRGTTVLVFEDLQWADPAQLDFIDHLLDWSKGVPLLIITLARPELFDRRPDWGAGRRTFTAIALEPLSDASMRELLAGLVPDLPESALAAISARADGIPLYAVETVRMLMADGRLEQVDGSYRPTKSLDSLAVPETLRSLISSRLDGLDTADRALVNDGSVLGQTFGLEAIAALQDTEPQALEPRLRRLIRREILTLQADPREPERGQYSFVQSLIQEVAYATLSRPDRRKRHLAAARYFEATASDELAAVLASHYVAAFQSSPPGAEADAVAAQARVALRAAADRAAALGGHEQAAAYLVLALDVTSDPGERARLQERAADHANLAGHYENAEPLARAAIEAYGAIGDVAGRARTRGLLGVILINSLRTGDAIQELERAVAELPADADPASRADVLVKLARAYYRRTDPERSIEAADKALVIAQKHDLRRTIAEALVTKGTALNMQARTYEAAALMRAGIALARREGDISTALRGMANIPGMVASEEGSAAAAAIMHDAIELARTSGDLGMLVWHTANLTWSTVYSGSPLTPTVARIEEVLSRRLEPSDRLHLETRFAVLLAIRGDDVDGILDELEPQVRAADDGPYASEIEYARALAHLAKGNYRTAAEMLAVIGEREPNFLTLPQAVLNAGLTLDAPFAQSMLERMDAVPTSGASDRAAREAARGVVAAVDGRRDEAMATVRPALAFAGDRGLEFHRALIGLAMVRALGPDDAEARALGEAALAIFERMGSVPLAAQVRDSLGAEVGSAA